MADLERALIDLGDHLDHPAGDHLPARVAAAVAAPQPRRARRRVVVAIAALVASVGALAAPAVGDWLGLGGVRVRQEPAPVAVPPSRLGAPLDLGVAIDLDEARRRAPYEVVVPTELGDPDEVWARTIGDRLLVSLVWAEPRALLTFVDARVDERVLLTKFAGPDTVVEEVEVDGARGLWVEGLHEVALSFGDGEIVIESLRLADRVLLWERGPVTLRLESDLGREASLRVAASVR